MVCSPNIFRDDFLFCRESLEFEHGECGEIFKIKERILYWETCTVSDYDKMYIIMT